MNIRKKICCLLTLFISLSVLGCSKKDSSEKQGELNILMGVEDKTSKAVIKFAAEEYQKEKGKTKITIIEGDKNNLSEEINKGQQDLIVVDRRNMIALRSIGLINEVKDWKEKNELKDKYISIILEYGRIGDKYYGLPLIPQLLKGTINKDSLYKASLSAPDTAESCFKLLKFMNTRNMSIPIFSEGESVNGLLFSILYNNIVKTESTEDIYGDKVTNYKDLKEPQKIFDLLNQYKKEGILNINTFKEEDTGKLQVEINNGAPFTMYLSNPEIKQKGTSNIALEELYLKLGISPPIVINGIMCLATNSKNSNSADEFIKYYSSTKFQEKLLNKGYGSGCKEALKKFQSNKEYEILHNSAGSKSMLIYDLPQNAALALEKEVERVLNGIYDGKEWQRVIESSGKK